MLLVAAAYLAAVELVVEVVDSVHGNLAVLVAAAAIAAGSVEPKQPGLVPGDAGRQRSGPVACSEAAEGPSALAAPGSKLQLELELEHGVVAWQFAAA